MDHSAGLDVSVKETSGHSTSDRKQRSILARSGRLVWLRVGSKQITVLSGGIRCAH